RRIQGDRARRDGRAARAVVRVGARARRRRGRGDLPQGVPRRARPDACAVGLHEFRRGRPGSVGAGGAVKTKVTRFFWWWFNPIARRLAGIAPWWVVVETTGRKSGKVRQAPLARGPVDGNVTWVIAVHGRHAGFVKNIEANPQVRFRL